MDSNDWRTGSDTGLAKLFAAGHPELPAEPFAAAVMRTVQRSARRRRLRTYVLGCAVGVGVALAAGPLFELLRWLWQVAVVIRSGAAETLGADVVAATQMYRMPVLAVLLCALAWLALARFVAR